MKKLMYTLDNVRKVPVVDAKQLATLTPVEAEVLSRVEDRRVRKTNLEKALTLGKSVKFKTSIVFDAKEGRHCVCDLVVSYAKDTVWFPGGINLPLHCIRSVDF